MRNAAFTLVELLIVILIIGIIAAVVIPCLMSAAEDAEKSALAADLTGMREALECYAIQHGGNYPTSLTGLAKYSSVTGEMSNDKTAVYKYGTYLMEIPPCPVGPNRGAAGWEDCTNPPGAESNTPTVGWLYHAASGSVWANDANYFDQ